MFVWITYLVWAAGQSSTPKCATPADPTAETITQDQINNFNNNPVCWGTISQAQLKKVFFLITNLQYVKPEMLTAHFKDPGVGGAKYAISFTSINEKFSLQGTGTQLKLVGGFGTIELANLDINKKYSIAIVGKKVTITREGRLTTIPELGPLGTIKAAKDGNLIIDISNLPATTADGKNILYPFDLAGGSSLTLITKVGTFYLKAAGSGISSIKVSPLGDIVVRGDPAYCYFRPVRGSKGYILYGNFRREATGRVTLFHSGSFQPYYINLEGNIGAAAPNGSPYDVIIGDRIAGAAEAARVKIDGGEIYAESGYGSLEVFRTWYMDPGNAMPDFNSVNSIWGDRKLVWQGHNLLEKGINPPYSTLKYNFMTNDQYESHGIFTLRVRDNAENGYVSLVGYKTSDYVTTVTYNNKDPDHNEGMTITSDESVGANTKIGVVTHYSVMPRLSKTDIWLEEGGVGTDVYLDQSGTLTLSWPVPDNVDWAMKSGIFPPNIAVTAGDHVVESKDGWFKIYGSTIPNSQIAYQMLSPQTKAKDIGIATIFAQTGVLKMHMDCVMYCEHKGADRGKTVEGQCQYILGDLITNMAAKCGWQCDSKKCEKWKCEMIVITKDGGEKYCEKWGYSKGVLWTTQPGCGISGYQC